MKALALLGICSLFTMTACGDDGAKEPAKNTKDDAGPVDPEPDAGHPPDEKDDKVAAACQAVLSVACETMAGCGVGYGSLLCLTAEQCVGFLTAGCKEALSPDIDKDSVEACSNAFESATCDDMCMLAIPDECDEFAGAFPDIPVPDAAAPPAVVPDSGAMSDAGALTSDAGALMSDAAAPMTDAAAPTSDAGSLVAPMSDAGTDAGASNDSPEPGNGDAGSSTPPMTGLGCYDVCLP